MNQQPMGSSTNFNGDHPELWGGIECTINRVGNSFFDQLQYAQHYKRADDLSAIGSLGIKKLRYPVLWEKHQPEENGEINWDWIAGQLDKLQQEGIDVIAGLVHHGSGPAYTNMLDEQWPHHLAAYARQVAERFPEIKHYTPVNEPLTTARFSGLYGIWFPHHCSDTSYLRMLVNELKGTVLAMQAIREVVPDARLVQTEDLGKTYSTPLLAYQAAFENERRWLTYDFLCGKVNNQHALYAYLIQNGITDADLQFFLDNPCVPDYFGFNHYVTSERYLDEKIDQYPQHCIGGNGKHQYADVEVVRVEVEEETGVKILLKEAWDRYQQPIVITEVHLHCHREEQLRWFQYVWNAANELKREGVVLEAVTAWAILGSFGWNKLLTKPKGTYEPGVFDLRAGYARPTALAKFLQQISQPERHRMVQEKGWWQRDTRYFHATPVVHLHLDSFLCTDNAPILIIGKNGTLGKAFAYLCRDRSIPFVLIGRQECDIADETSIQKALDTYKPWAVVNTAGYVRVDEAERDASRCFRENTVGAAMLANACRQNGIRFLTFSSDLVFDGKKGKPYRETDRVNPLNVYGQSKVAAEKEVLAANPDSLVVRTSAFFGPWDEFNFLHYVIENLAGQKQVTAASDVLVSPTYVPDLVHTALDLLIDEETGIRHLANKGVISWADLAFEAAKIQGLNSSLINGIPLVEMNLDAPRPKYSVLGTEKGMIMPTLDDALGRYARERKPRIASSLII